jgi:hypothetical protein
METANENNSVLVDENFSRTNTEANMIAGSKSYMKATSMNSAVLNTIKTKMKMCYDVDNLAQVTTEMRIFCQYMLGINKSRWTGSLTSDDTMN